VSAAGLALNGHVYVHFRIQSMSRDQTAGRFAARMGTELGTKCPAY
jgi:hypothetical protein